MGLWEFANEKWYIILNGIIALVLLAIFWDRMVLFITNNFMLLLFLGMAAVFVWLMMAEKEEDLKDPQKLLEYACKTYKSLRKLGINPSEKFEDMKYRFIGNGTTKFWIYRFQQNMKRYVLFLNAKNGMPLDIGEAKNFAIKTLSIHETKDLSNDMNYFNDETPQTPSSQPQSPPPLQQVQEQPENAESFYLDEPTNNKEKRG